VTTSVGDGPSGAFVVSAGETVDIDIILSEFDFGQSSFPRLGIGNSDGVTSFSFGVEFSGSGVTIESEADVAINPVFDNASELSVELHSLVLATVTVTGVVPDSETSIIASLHTNGEPVLFADGSEEATRNFSLGGIEILVTPAAVPEPSASLLLFGMGSFVLTVRKRRRAV